MMAQPQPAPFLRRLDKLRAVTSPRRRLAALFIAAVALVAPAAAQAEGRCGDHPWCDTTKTADERAALVLAQLTLPEKLDLLWGDEQFGVANPPAASSTPGATPATPASASRTCTSPTARSARARASVDGDAGADRPRRRVRPALARRAGGLVADEVKAKGNDVVFAPTVNIMRTPRGGRTFEGYGEDPFLRRARGRLDRGAQADGVIADVKHFAANNQEGDDRQDRMSGSTSEDIDERTLREIYLPQFEAAVKQGHAAR